MEINNEIKIKKPVNVRHLANWYFGNFCAHCGRIDSESDRFDKDCSDKIHSVANQLDVDGIENMTHKEFRELIKNSSFCKPIKRVFHECPICKALGIPQRRW